MLLLRISIIFHKLESVEWYESWLGLVYLDSKAQQTSIFFPHFLIFRSVLFFFSPSSYAAKMPLFLPGSTSTPPHLP